MKGYCLGEPSLLRCVHDCHQSFLDNRTIPINSVHRCSTSFWKMYQVLQCMSFSAVDQQALSSRKMPAVSSTMSPLGHCRSAHVEETQLGPTWSYVGILCLSWSKSWQQHQTMRWRGSFH